MKGLRGVATALGLVAAIAFGLWLLRLAKLPEGVTAGDATRHRPVVVAPEQRLPPVVSRPPRLPIPRVDEPLIRRRRIPVQMTMYCLQGTTRRGLPVRHGIIATDPRVIPLGTVVDLYIGLRYAGRYLADDTGRLIKGQIIDIWTPDCREAVRFGRRRGAVVIVPDAPDPTSAPGVR